MSVTGDIVQPDGTIIESHTAVDYTALRARADSLGLLVGAFGEQGGPGPARTVPSDLLTPILNGNGIGQAAIADVTALVDWVAANP